MPRSVAIDCPSWAIDFETVRVLTKSGVGRCPPRFFLCVESSILWLKHCYGPKDVVQ